VFVAYSHERLGELLVAGEAITDDQLQEALDVQERVGGKLGEILVSELILDEDVLARALAEQRGLEHVNLASHPIDRAAASLLPERFASLRAVIPISVQDDVLILAMADPLDIETIDDVEMRTGLKVDPAVAALSQITYAIDKFITSAGAYADVVDSIQEAEEEEEAAGGEEVPVVRLVNQLIREAVVDGVSDIHIEPEDKEVIVRYRVDGVLHEVMRLPIAARAGITSRIKIMAEMDIAERRRPQDGRIAVKVKERPVDIRVATLPTPEGESLVLRILNTELTFHSLDNLGLSPRHLETVERMLTKPHGAIMLAGPTGSGKSTTLYAGLKELNTSDRKIITIEDPIEYRMGGLTQMAVNPKIGLTFASLLRQVLRSDPDIVMGGEIRDPETAEISVRAALTGHLVLTSVHTNDAPSALTRLVDMGVPSYITSSALLGVVSQRLVRVLCPDCKKPSKLSKERLCAAGFQEDELEFLEVSEAVGCDKCSQSGYKGRLGIFEIMELTDDITRLFLKDAAAEELRQLALEKGMVSLRRDALDKVAAGITSLTEIDRVVV
jgi:type IV pilus assembly protein PilB